MLNAETIWNADGYTRVSKDDRDKDESNSIKNQRDLIADFVKSNPDIRLSGILSDDGFTGANFDRNAFQNVISHIEEGLINCVIVKDFSRLGREHIGTLKYIQRYFTSKNVRFIAINEPYDSLYTDMSDSNNSLVVPFKTIINEAFLEDISVKTRSQLAIKRKKGEFIGNYATYGYLKAADKKLAVDEYAAGVVRFIFDRKLAGQGEKQIACELNDRGELSPAEYKKASGQAYNTPFAVNDKSLWTVTAIRRILMNRVYIGVLEQGKRTKVSYRAKKHFYTPREAWSVHENSHEPVVSETDFKLVQELMAKDTRVSASSNCLHLFSGIVYCGNCGQPMVVKTATKGNGKKYINYFCHTHKKTGSCTYNNISSLALERIALEAIRQHIAMLLSAQDLSGCGLGELKERKRAVIEDMIGKALQSIEKNNGYIVKSCANMLDGVLTEDEYKRYSESFTREIEKIEGHIARLRLEIEQLEDDVKTNEIIERFKEHENITELDRRVVISLIRRVVVRDGARDLEICFRFGFGHDGSSEYDFSAERTVV
jgi:DNA invertase Pin-like site-specific DNA recombinase